MVNETVGYWKDVDTWCLGENDTFGTCAFAMCGNHDCVVSTFNGAPEIMSDGEIEAMDHAVTGFIPTDPKSDHGTAVATLLQYWHTNGWTGDPMFKPVTWHQVTFDQIADTIKNYAACYAWFMLPHTPDGIDYDFSDDAVTNNVPGVGPHAMLIVGAQPGFFQIVTWGEVKTVSEEWITKFGQGYFAVQHPNWKMPT